MYVFQKSQEIFLFSKMPKPAVELPNLLFNSYCGSFPRVNRPVTTHLHLVPKLRMRGAVSLLLLYAFVACTGTTLYGKCQGSMKTRPTAHTSLSRRPHRNGDSNPAPKVTSRTRRSRTGFRRQQGV